MFINSAFRKFMAIGLIAILISLFTVLSAYPQIPALKTKPKSGLVKVAYSIPLEAHETFYNSCR
jgi:hypothetical protein